MKKTGLILLPGLVLAVSLSGCADLGYYLHSARGQWSIMQQTRDIDEVIADPSSDPRLREKLQQVQQIRRFAFEQLALPRSDSYREYADLGRPYVLKNLFAADEFSIQLQRWCYPLVGCAGYRGFFDLDRLQEFESDLQAQGKDFYIANVSAYSTLGWFDDPVLNTFIFWPDYRLAGLIFHELAHQRLYIDDDTRFNESFASAVQQAGVERWLKTQGEMERLARYRHYLNNRAQVIALIEQAREDLSRLYQQALAPAVKRQRKQQRLTRLREQYQEMTAGFTGPDGFARWFSGPLNNAKLASVSTYYAQVQQFRQVLECLNGDFDAFYRQVEIVGALPAENRARSFKQTRLSLCEAADIAKASIR